MKKVIQSSLFEGGEFGRSEPFLVDGQYWLQSHLNANNVTSESRVLVISCPQGEISAWLTKQIECELVEIDPLAVELPHLPFPDKSFTHVWSETTLSQISEHQQVLAEIERVLQEDGILMLNDFVRLVTQTAELQGNEVEQLHSIKSFVTSQEYAKCLNRSGLMVLDSLDLTAYLRENYSPQLERHQVHKSTKDLDRVDFSREIIDAIDAGSLGCYFYICKKVGDRLQWIHNNKDTDELRRKYDAWAALYEDDLDNSWLMPVHAARLLDQLQSSQGASKAIAILDAGAGTGKVGQSLKQLGYSNITAMDLSVGMLEEARKKDVYSAMYAANLEEPLTFCDPETFDAITAIGVFTYGHASPAGLFHLLPLLKPGGLFLITVRASNQSMQDAFKDLPWSLVKQEDYEFDTAPFYLLAYKKE